MIGSFHPTNNLLDFIRVGNILGLGCHICIKTFRKDSITQVIFWP